MTYKELEERVNQQGTQCGVNLMSSAVLEVEVDTYNEGIRVASALAFAFGFSEEDTYEDGIIYKDTFMKLLQKFRKLTIEHKMPNIKFICSYENTFTAFNLDDFYIDTEDLNISAISWRNSGDLYFATYEDLPPRES